MTKEIKAVDIIGSINAATQAVSRATVTIANRDETIKGLNAQALVAAENLAGMTNDRDAQKAKLVKAESDLVTVRANLTTMTGKFNTAEASRVELAAEIAEIEEAIGGLNDATAGLGQ